MATRLPAANPTTRDVLLTSDVLNALAVIKAQAQVTHRRIQRVEQLNRDHIASDLMRIDAQATRLANLLHVVTPAQAARPDGLTWADRPARCLGGLVGIGSPRLALSDC